MSRSELLALPLLLAACSLPAEAPSDAPHSISTQTQAIHNSHTGPPPWKHVLTCFGGCQTPHYDSSACGHHQSCGPIADGTWWYATERAAFHCGAKLKLVRGDKCVVVDVQDNGPADWVESNAHSKCGTPYIIDTSPLVHDYFGGGCGWGECFLVDVYPVADDTPTGPGGCNTCDCTPGHVDTAACGNCGTHTRTCGANCRWEAWSACHGQGPCAAGQKDTRPCCDCGAQTRTCGSDCQWDPWSTCGGPDPEGGNTACDTGESGPCAEGRMRCEQGCLKCARIHEPEPERCDAIDNNCNGLVDDDNPKKMGVPPPAFAAQIEDASYPQSLAPNEVDSAWVAFRNVGTKPWPRGKVWLGSVRASQGKPSPLQAIDRWPAWDVAGAVDEDVEPGAVTYVAFFLQAAEPRTSQHDQFRLIAPDGTPMACPSPSIDVTVSVEASRDSEPAKASGQHGPGAGCSQSPRRSPAQGAALLVAFLPLAARARRRGSRLPTQSFSAAALASREGTLR